MPKKDTQNNTPLVENTKGVSETIKNKDVEKAAPETAENTDIEKVISGITDAVNDISGIDVSEGEFDIIEDEININPNKRIIVKSLNFGKLVYINPITKARYVWKDYGATLPLTWTDIQSMHNEKPEYLLHPYLLINDKEVINYYNLGDVYRNISVITKLETILNTGNLNLVRQKLAEIINLGLKDAAVAKIRKLREKRELDSKDIIDIIREEFKLDME